MSTKPPSRPDKRKPVVLVVSRDSNAAAARKRLLEEAGFEVVAAMNLQQVTDASKRYKIRLAIVGYSLPPAEKRRVANAISEGSRVPVLELHKDGPQLMDTGFSHHSQTPDDFIDAVRELLKKTR